MKRFYITLIITSIIAVSIYLTIKFGPLGDFISLPEETVEIIDTKNNEVLTDPSGDIEIITTKEEIIIENEVSDDISIDSETLEKFVEEQRGIPETPTPVEEAVIESKETKEEVVVKATPNRVPQITVTQLTGKNYLYVGKINMNFAQYTEKKISIKNTGNDTLIISKLRIGGKHYQNFKLKNQRIPLTIKPGTSQDLIVTFTPFTSGKKTAQLVITSNDQDQSLYTVNLEGASIDDLAVITNIELEGQITEGKIKDHYALIASGNKGLWVMDLKNPESPVKVKQVKTSGEVFGIAIKGNYAYLADYYEGLVVVNITNPAQAKVVKTLPLKGEANKVFINDNYAYVADGSAGVQIINITTPTDPRIIKTIDTPGIANDMYISGQYCYVADDIKGIHVIDISDIRKASIIKTFKTSGYSKKIVIKGKFAYIADSSNGVVIIDISNPMQPFQVKVIREKDVICESVVVSNHYVYAGLGSKGLQIINISNPKYATIIKTIPTNGPAFGSFIYGNYLYQCNWNKGIGIYAR